MLVVQSVVILVPKKKSGFEWKIDLYSTNTVLIGSTAQR